jgi:hypothetical protein
LNNRQQHWAIRHWPQRVESISQGPMIGEFIEQGAFQQHRFTSGIFNNSFSGTSTAASIPTPPRNINFNFNIFKFIV